MVRYKPVIYTLMLLIASVCFVDVTWAVGSAQEAFLNINTDLSIEYLSQIFGSVGNVLFSGQQPFLGRIFRIINLGMVAFAGTFLTYTIMSETAISSQSGQKMSEKINFWVGTRFLLGISFLLPQSDGYCMMQKIIMTATIQGVQVADKLWQTAIKTTLEKGGFFYQSTDKFSKYNEEQAILLKKNRFVSQAKPLFGSYFCNQYLKYKLEELKNEKDNDQDKQAIEQIKASVMIRTSEDDKTLPKNLQQEKNIGSSVRGCQGDNPQSSYFCYGYQLSPQDHDPTHIAACGRYQIPLVRQDEVIPTSEYNTVQKLHKHRFSNALMIANSLNKFNLLDITSIFEAHGEVDIGNSMSLAIDFLLAQTQRDINSRYNHKVTACQTERSTTSTVVPCNAAQGFASFPWAAQAICQGWITAPSYLDNLFSTGPQKQSCETKIQKESNSIYLPFLDSDITKSSQSNKKSPLQDEVKTRLKDVSTIKSMVNKMRYTKIGSSTQNFTVQSSVNTDPLVKYHLNKALKILLDSFIGKPIESGGKKSRNLNNLSWKASGDHFKNMSHMTFLKQVHDIVSYQLSVMLSSTLSAITGVSLIDKDLSVDFTDDKIKLLIDVPRAYNPEACATVCLNDDDQTCFTDAIKKGCIIEGVGLFGGMAAQLHEKYQDNIIFMNTHPVVINPLKQLVFIGVTMLQSSAMYFRDTALGLYQQLHYMATTLLVIASAAAFLTIFLPSSAGLMVSKGAEAYTQMGFKTDIYAMFLYSPLGSMLAVFLFGLGVLLGVYVPFIPRILFLFTVLGWFVTVFEAMLAGPLVAIGLAHPQGQDLVGKAEQATMLLFSLFLRPVLITLGFLVSILFSHCAADFIHRSFLVMMTHTFFEHMINIESVIKVLVILGVMFIYVWTMLAVLNQSFAIIYLLPDRALRWLGMQEEQSSVKESMATTQEGMTQSGQAIGSGAAKSSGSIQNIAGSFGQARADANIDQDLKSDMSKARKKQKRPKILSMFSRSRH